MSTVLAIFLGIFASWGWNQVAPQKSPAPVCQEVYQQGDHQLIKTVQCPVTNKENK